MPRFASPALVLLLAVGATAGATVPWSDVPRQPAAWHASDEARAMADSVLRYQTESGGWPKNTDLAAPVPGTSAEAVALLHEPTIDNGATTTPLHFLARVISARPDPRYRAAFDRGLAYLLAAQYENGGWPQFYPLRSGYYTHITYNDNAMTNVLTLLRSVSLDAEPYAFIAPEQRAAAAQAVARGITCILRTQVRQEGKLTVWCAQHDEQTFAPAWARKFEPPSLSGQESVGIVRFLMSFDDPSPEMVAAIEGAVAWFRTVPVHGWRVDNTPGADGKKDRHVVTDPAAPVLWARFYELGTNRPIFIGRDSILRYDFNEIERERRTGYAYLGDWPARLLEQDYPRWRARHSKP